MAKHRRLTRRARAAAPDQLAVHGQLVRPTVDMVDLVTGRIHLLTRDATADPTGRYAALCGVAVLPGGDGRARTSLLLVVPHFDPHSEIEDLSMTRYLDPSTATDPIDSDDTCSGCGTTSGVQSTLAPPRVDAWMCRACGMHWAVTVVNPALSIIGVLPTPQLRTAALRADVARRSGKGHTTMTVTVCLPAPR